MTAETEPAAISGRPRLARRVLEVPPSGIRKFFDVLATMPDVISLGIGEPDFTTPPQVIEEGVRSLRSGRTHYTSNFGTIELRRALSRNLERLYGVSYDPDGEILVTVGASEALAIALAAIIDPGDEVILHEPSYVAYVPGITFAGGVPVLVRHEPGRRLGARPDAGWRRPSRPEPRCCSWATPATPPVPCWSPGQLRAIADIVERHDLLVISDEIYDRLVYGDHQHEAFSALPGMRERTILLGGFSKAYAMTGWRVGYACAPRDLIEGLVKVHQYQIMSAPDDRPGRRAGRADRRGAGRPADGRRVRPAPADVRRWAEPDRPAHGRAPGRVLRLPAHRRHGPHQRAVQRAAAVRAPGRGGARARPSGRPVRATCGPAWPPATSSWRRRWCASSASCPRLDSVRGATVRRRHLPRTASRHASASAPASASWSPSGLSGLLVSGSRMTPPRPRS